ncbi:YeeE/YedE family protein [Vibrio sp. SM6]|uniref:YeeE/YedE family protein n=1 Tax=Vibrio agarilyticus TaxID=2726741 RepID=A0A7X8YHE5_9VIBR|nr:YeeE/YedE family protein [Vibrio agarilyticus]
MTIPWDALFGGMLLGAGAVILLLFNGKIAGISGIINGWLQESGVERLWRQWFIIGVIASSALMVSFLALPTANLSSVSISVLIIAGLLVGFGTRLGNGCTSGHGICGLGRLSLRSLAATMTFMAAAMITVLLRLHGM